MILRREIFDILSMSFSMLFQIFLLSTTDNTLVLDNIIKIGTSMIIFSGLIHLLIKQLRRLTPMLERVLSILQVLGLITVSAAYFMSSFQREFLDDFTYFKYDYFIGMNLILLIMYVIVVWGMSINDQKNEDIEV